VGEKVRIMSNDPNIDITDATNPAALMAAVIPVDNAVIAARFGDPPDGMVAGVSPVGISTADQVCGPAGSVLGADLIEGLGPAAHLPDFKAAFASSFGGGIAPEPAPDTPKYDVQYDTPEFT